MKAQIIQFSLWRKKMKQKQIDPELLALVMKHHKLIHLARRRGYSDKAIVALVKSAESSKREA